MATIDDIITWVDSLPAWQGDAVRRLLASGDQPLNAQDYSEILSLAKAELKIALPPDNLKPVLPVAGNFSGSPETTVAVKLLSIDDVRNVNIIKDGQTQPFAESGVTVVYGDNGSGKSGYSRILKLACQARDKDERILPNVFATAPTGTPTAILKIKQDDKPRDIVWTQGIPADPILTNITVFDGRCARVITDDRNEISYLPYGGDVFQKLAEIVLRVKADVEAEITAIVPIQDSAIVASTTSAKFLESLSEITKDEVIQAATDWTPQDELQLFTQEELARTSDSTKATQEVARLDKINGRINDAASAVTRLSAVCAELTNEAIQKVMAEVNAAQLAHSSAVAERQTPEALPGVGSTNQWEILYKAAKQYSEEIAYPGESFPKTYDAFCVLCQQPLGEEAVARFGRFKKFMEDVTSTVLVAKRNALKLLREKIEAVDPLTAAPLESIYDELASLDVKAANDLRVYHTAVATRKFAVLALLKEGEDPQKVALLPPWPASVETALRPIVKTLIQKATDITNAAKPEEYKKLLATVAELKSRKALSARKADICAFIAKIRRNADLRRAAATLRTYEITRQGTTVIRKNLTPELINAFKNELIALGATRVPISLKPSGDVGETAHEILLEGANTLGRARTSQILSEGEARVIAIAGFLAELQLVPHANTIVLDDPVSSLDHVFAGKIAARLAREGLRRQVIIFTHNIAFLMELEDASMVLAMAGTPVGVTVHTLRRGGKSAGITTNGAPWYALKVKQRAQYMEELVHKIKPLYPDNMAEYNEKAARIYGLLREAWESCVEDDLFYNVVCRYRNSVQTLKLIEVDIEDLDIHHVDLHMSRASTWMTGHDKSKALHTDRPAPDELLADINALRGFSKQLIDRREQTKKRRNKQLEP
ncbi:MAG TPA: AAA family ATPase [Candidatus Omnitrophota bacterium]|nr:AAA family ATPase [Candidatus Omnitrophota bacterium]